jgi:hypothetical protein
MRPGARLLGSTFLAQGSRRQRMLLRNEDFGHTASTGDLRRWLGDRGLTDVSIDREDGLAVFGARKPG